MIKSKGEDDRKKGRICVTYRERMEAYRERAEALARQDSTEALRQALTLLKKAIHIVIGAGAGLSAAGGLDYQSEEALRREFPGLAAMGYRTLWEALWDPKRTKLQRHAMTAAEALWARFDFPVIAAYRDLLSLVGDKNYFVLTSNVDDQFYKAGFAPDRVFAPQNSIANLQCSVPCCRDIWSGEEAYRRIAAHTGGDFSCREEDLPRCPRCGAPAVWNMRGRECFIPDQVMAARAPFERFFEEASKNRAVFLELGVGFNSPGLIRHPFQRMTGLWPNAALIRVNRDYPSVPEKIRGKSVELGGDIAENLRRLKELDARA